MNIGLVNRDTYFDNDRIFQSNITPDYITYGWVELRNHLLSQNIKFYTINDDTQINKTDKFIFNEFPSGSFKKKLLKINKPKYLILFESSLLINNNYHNDNFKYFDKIFTWNNDLIKSDSNKFFKINFALPIKKLLSNNINGKRDITASMVCGNKYVKGYGELYSYRKDIINYFDKHNDLGIKLYGKDWNKFRVSSHTIFGKSINKIAKYIDKKPPIIWNGIVESKMDIYHRSKFSIAIENLYKQNGYITEKIVHSLLALTKPFYLGDESIKRYVPSEFYIDLKDIDFDEVSNIIKNTSNSELNNMRYNLYDYIYNDGLIDFDTKNNNDIICNQIL